MLECDVLIVGCGPAGASLALYLAQKNIKVIVAEKKKNLDTPVRCAGFVPVNIAGLFDFKINGINNRTDYLETYVAKNPSEKFQLIAKTSAPGFILNRDIFINDIASRLVASGGKLLKGTKVISVQQNPDGFTFDLSDSDSKNHLTVKAKIVAAADGPLSLIGRLIGSPNKSFMPAIQQNPAIILENTDCNKVFLAPYIPCGYGWLFPKTDSINLGIGAANTFTSIKDTLAVFTRHLKFSGILKDDINIQRPVLYNNSIQSVTGLIPDSGIVENPGTKDGFILCGDAAGLCNPVTGAGIYNAVHSAKLAAEIIFKALSLNDLSILQEAKEVYKSQFGNSINRALRKKIIQKNNWPRNIPEIDDFPPVAADMNGCPEHLPDTKNNWPKHMPNNKINRPEHMPTTQNSSDFDYKDSKDNIEFMDLVRQTWISFKDYWH